MTGFDFTPQEEDQIDLDMEDESSRILNYQTAASDRLAATMNEYQKKFSFVDPSLLLPTVRAVADGAMSEETADKFLMNFQREATLDMIRRGYAIVQKNRQEQADKSWFERNIFDKFKTGSRYTMATLNFVPQVVGGTAAQIFNDKEPVSAGGGSWGGEPEPQLAETGGWFIATDLGSLIANDEVAGEGYFISGRAKELQAERERAYRGTVNGSSWTFGRGLASVFYEPGDREYQILSGLVDAAAAFAIPSAPGAKIVSRAGQAAVGAAGARTLVGLTRTGSKFVDPDKVSTWLNGRAGRGVVKRLINVENVDEAAQIFPNADPRFWLELKTAAAVDRAAEAAVPGTAKAVDQLLSDSLGLGDITRGIAARSIDDVNITRWDGMKNYFRSNGGAMGRLMNKRYGRVVALSVSNERDAATSIKTLSSYLRNLRVDPTVANKLIDDFAEKLVAGNYSARTLVPEFERIERAAFEAMGLNDKIIDSLLKGKSDLRRIINRKLQGAIDDTGNSADYGEHFESIVNGQTVVTKQPLNTAALQSEAINDLLILADSRRVIRLGKRLNSFLRTDYLTSKTGRFNPDKAGELRSLFSGIEIIQNYLWRPLTLFTGGYITRNISDGLLRQTVNPNVKLGLSHPLELILVATFRKYKGDILGDTFKGSPEELLRAGQRELAEASNATVRELDPITLRSRQRQTNAWETVSVDSGIDLYAEGVAAEITLLSDDFVARMVAEGADETEIIRALETTKEGKAYVDGLIGRWANRELIEQATNNKVMGSVIFRNPDGTVHVPNMTKYILGYIKPRIDAVTGNNQNLKDVIANRFVIGGNGQPVELIARTTSKGDMFTDDFLEQIKTVAGLPNRGGLKETYKRMRPMKVVNPNDGSPLAGVIEGFDKATDWFFGSLYPRREAFLNRSPVFRQQYYEAVDEFLENLSQPEVKKILDALKDVAKNANKKFTKRWLSNYVGSSDLARRIIDGAEGAIPLSGKLTAEELNEFAKLHALDSTKRLFYNAAERSNFADALRIIAPFGPAWAEVTKNWVKELSKNPELVKRGGVMVNGLQEADPDGDGRGFFWKNPTTGEYMFSYPFGEWAIPLMSSYTLGLAGGLVAGPPGLAAGVVAGAGLGEAGRRQIAPALEDLNVEFAAPTKTLNMGFNILPGVGPVVQFAAGEILKNKPQLDAVSKIISPYGAPGLKQLFQPAWFDKFYNGLFGNPETNRLLADLNMQAQQALSTTGKYDLANVDDRERLQNDAAQAANVLMVLRGLGQFVGPTRPSIFFKVEKRDGKILLDGEEVDLSQVDLYTQEVAKYFFQLREEDYDTAVMKFLETFGDDFFLFVADKTKSVSGGLDVSTEFGKWERSNQRLFNRYEEVAGYFGPVGSNFDYQVYLRQLATGKRERLSPSDLIDEAQAIVGMSAYRAAKRELGAKPTSEQREILAEFKDQLIKQYPGYGKIKPDYGKIERQIRGLEEAAFDPLLDDNPVAEGLRLYLEVRSGVLAQIDAAGGSNDLSTQGNTRYADGLFLIGEQIARQIPEFERVWNRVLVYELEVE